MKPDHLPWRTQSDPIHGASIYDAKGNQIVAHVYDEENATTIVGAVNSAHALRNVLEEIKSTGQVERAALKDETPTFTRWAIKVADTALGSLDK